MSRAWPPPPPPPSTKDPNAQGAAGGSMTLTLLGNRCAIRRVVGEKNQNKTFGDNFLVSLSDSFLNHTGHI